MPWYVLVSDVLFICAVVFFISGMTEVVMNTGFFNGLVFGTKSLYRLVRQKLGSSSAVKEEYLEYVKNRPKHGDVTALFAIGGALAAASVLAYVLAGRF